MVFLFCFLFLSHAEVPQVDLHLDTPTQLFVKGLSWNSKNGLEAGLSQLKEGGTNAPVMVLWPSRKTDPVKRVFNLMKIIEKEVARSRQISLARSPADVRRIVKEEGVAVIVSMEGAYGLGSEKWQKNLKDLHGRGLSILGLTWSYSNIFAGSSGDGGKGVTVEGHKLLKLAEELGIVIDVSHASRETTLAVCKGSKVPVIASHSDCHAIQSHPRNLTDEEIRCIAKTGGVIGVNFHAPFVGRGANVKKVADHLEHFASVGGYQVVALGSDFDGYIRKPKGLENASKLPDLWKELKSRGWTQQQLNDLRGENFLRAWEKVLESRTR